MKTLKKNGDTYVHSFSNSFPNSVITEYWVELPLLYSKSLLITYRWRFYFLGHHPKFWYAYVCIHNFLKKSLYCTFGSTFLVVISLVCCDSWGRKESDTTQRLIWYAFFLRGRGDTNIESITHLIVFSYQNCLSHFDWWVQKTTLPQCQSDLTERIAQFIQISTS